MDTPGVRHYALIGPSDCGDPYLCDAFTPCMGYIENALNTNDDVSAVTCFACLGTRFDNETQHMNLDAIEHLNEGDLFEHFVDRNAMIPDFL